MKRRNLTIVALLAAMLIVSGVVVSSACAAGVPTVNGNKVIENESNTFMWGVVSILNPKSPDPIPGQEPTIEESPDPGPGSNLPPMLDPWEDLMAKMQGMLIYFNWNGDALVPEGP